jgi:DNA-binding MarR family transcriptional regulator
LAQWALGLGSQASALMFKQITPTSFRENEHEHPKQGRACWATDRGSAENSPRSLKARCAGAESGLCLAGQRVDNAIGEWMAGSVGSAARYQVLMALWASEEKGISHTEIVAAMGVTRATVSGLMAGLERDGLVKSCVDPVDRRKQIARLTQKGEAVMKKQHALNVAKFDVVFASFTLEELASLTELLHRFEKCFANPTEESSVQLP